MSRQSLVTFRLGGERYALRASSVDEIVPAASIGPLPHAPGVVAGVLVVRGELMPVFEVRPSLGLPVRPVGANDHFVVARTRGRRVVVVTEGAEDVVGVEEAALTAARVLSERGPLGAFVARLEDGTSALLDLDAFLSAAERLELDAALEKAASS